MPLIVQLRLALIRIRRATLSPLLTTQGEVRERVDFPPRPPDYVLLVNRHVKRVYVYASLREKPDPRSCPQAGLRLRAPAWGLENTHRSTPGRSTAGVSGSRMCPGCDGVMRLAGSWWCCVCGPRTPLFLFFSLLVVTFDFTFHPF